MTELAPQLLSPHHTALRCLFVVSLQLGVVLKPENFAGFTDDDTVASVTRVMKQVGLQSRVLRDCNLKKLQAMKADLPLMALLNDGHWVIVTKLTKPGRDARVGVLNPQCEKDGSVDILAENFLQDWSGLVISCRRPPRTNAASAEPEFGLRWFIPEILKHHRYLRDVAIAAIMSSIVAFATPLMFQILIDKVITHRSYQTLTALLLIFFTLTLFDGIFSYTRQYSMLFITSKIDARLASKTFQQLLRLPMLFFEATTAGIVTRHLQQTETIRHFLTGRLFQTMLDAVALPVTLTFLILYSGKLTAIVLGFACAIALIIAVMVPAFRRQLEQLYAAEGARQGHLVETIHGMRTVKSLALEPSRLQAWNDAVALGVLRRASVGKISALANVLTQGLEKLMQITVLAMGAIDVFDSTLSIGALVAFNMLSGRVSGPLVQIVGLINEYQEVSLAVKMLGVVMQHPPERQPGVVGMTPQINGMLEFDRVTFRYPGAGSPALDNLTFVVPEGKVIGIVGRSGSGKTTITRLIQGVQNAQDGIIRIDGVDIRNIDLQHLRRSIGVVLQENFLFRGTIRDNIAATKPDAELTEVIEAARMAGAAEFIERLPKSYETMVEENGANFSGGQRQRIAIARALLTRPRMLIFDEATSALDPESESIVQAHIDEIAEGRTLVIVSHRLTSLANADAILVLDNGTAVDYAHHSLLLERCEIYQRLWWQQTSRFL